MSALRFHELTVKRVAPEAAGSVAVTFDIPASERDAFDFQPGQFLTLRARVVTQLAPAWTTDWMTEAGKEKLRAYGIAPPHQTPAGSNVVRFISKPAAAETVPCPHCGSANTRESSHFGSTACKALYKCQDCQEPFDYFKPY